MKKILCAILILTLFMAEAVTAYAAGPQEPTIEAQMPDCYGIVGESAIMLFTNAASPRRRNAGISVVQYDRR